MKMLLEQIRLLRQRGHYVIAAMRSDTAPSALPPWTDVGADEDVVSHHCIPIWSRLYALCNLMKVPSVESLSQTFAQSHE